MNESEQRLYLIKALLGESRDRSVWLNGDIAAVAAYLAGRK